MFNKEIKQRLDRIEEILFKERIEDLDKIEKILFEERDSTLFINTGLKKKVNLVKETREKLEELEKDLKVVEEKILNITKYLKPQLFLKEGEKVEFKLLGKKFVGEICEQVSGSEYRVYYLDANNKKTSIDIKVKDIKKINK